MRISNGIIQKVKICPTATTTNPMWNDLGSNEGLRGEKRLTPRRLYCFQTNLTQAKLLFKNSKSAKLSRSLKWKFCFHNPTLSLTSFVPYRQHSAQTLNSCFHLQETNHAWYDIWVSILQLAVYCHASHLFHLLVFHIYLQLLEGERHTLPQTNTWVWQHKTDVLQDFICWAV